MPVIVVGADTDIGLAIVTALAPNAAETRAFVTDVDSVDRLKALGAKVAAGDVSDISHVEAAATRCFCAVLVTRAASDDRVRSFADRPRAVLDGWAAAVSNSAVTRTIWVGDPDDPIPDLDGELAFVDQSSHQAATEVARLEGLLTLE